MDLRANIDSPITLDPLARTLVPTGLYMALPAGYEAQVRPRSGLALKKGITVLNTPGTIDADYRGEIGVIVINYGSDDVTIAPGDRICQAVVCKYTRVEWQSADSLGETSRGEGGFGHTGL